MRFIYLGFVLRLSWEVMNVCCLVSNSGSGSSPKNNSGSESSSLSGYNPSDKATVKSGTTDKHLLCRNECLSLKKQISDIYEANHGNIPVKFLHNRCGMVTDGQIGTGLFSSACLCHTPNASKTESRSPSPNSSKSLKRARVKFCRQGLHLIQTFKKPRKTTRTSEPFPNRRKIWTNEQEMRSNHWPANGEEPPIEEVGMFSCCGGGSDNRPSKRPRTSQGRPRTPAAPPLHFKREDDTKSSVGYLLLTDVIIARQRITALIDTGSSITSIHPALSDDSTDYEGEPLLGAHGPIDVLGVTTIDVWLNKHVKIKLTGLMTQLTDGVLLGNDFFRKYKAKISPMASTMVLTVNGNTVTMKTRWGTNSDIHFAGMIKHGPISPLFIPLLVNEVETETILDTGASATSVNRNLINEKDIYYDGATNSASFFHGKCLIRLQFESKVLTYPAFLPKSPQPIDLIIGNEFNAEHVDLIDYESNQVTIQFPGSVGSSSTIVPFLN